MFLKQAEHALHAFLAVLTSTTSSAGFRDAPGNTVRLTTELIPSKSETSLALCSGGRAIVIVRDIQQTSHSPLPSKAECLFDREEEFRLAVICRS